MAAAPGGTLPESVTHSKKGIDLGAFWRTLTRLEPEKIVYGRSTRNAIGVALPLAVGYLASSLPAGLVISSGALNVCFTDGDDPYRQRARRMLLGTLLVGLAVLTGTLVGHTWGLAILITGAWAFSAGMMAAISQNAADMGVTTLVTLIVYSAQPLEPNRAVIAGLLAIAGGLLQTLLALAFWPVQRHEPERKALAALYEGLAKGAEAPAAVSEAPVASAAATEAHKTLASLVAVHTVEADRYRSLLSQAERMRLSLLALARLRVRIGREKEDAEEAAALDDFFRLCARVLASIGASLKTGDPLDQPPGELDQISALTQVLRSRQERADSDVLAAFGRDVRYQADALAGQLRSAVELASYSTAAGHEEFERTEARAPWTLRLRGGLATLRANFTFESAAFRHAVRLAGCVALAAAIGRAVSLRRTYWLPMTVAIVLKPDFTATFSRGVLRMIGTLAGLAFATMLFHVLSATVMTQIVLIGMLTFVLRSYGAANYSILTAAVSALVVLLIGLTGVSASDVIAARALNSLAGGTLALTAYWLWPTWEHYRVNEYVARLLDAYRDYFHAIVQRYLDRALLGAAPHKLDAARQAARLARSNLTASVDRLSSEPYKFRLIALNDMLTSSHRLVHALMALEAGLYSSKFAAPRAAFRTFSNDVEKTLYFLAASLRGTEIHPGDLADLREDHHALLREGDGREGRYALVNIETDRITNSLNTLREQIISWPPS
ncbi:MAG TPA: FUSC family protein [Bryobacteraceae bacterium]|nr:FUSC family protein [Bryobacteraceae bacterium]